MVNFRITGQTPAALPVERQENHAQQGETGGHRHQQHNRWDIAVLGCPIIDKIGHSKLGGRISSGLVQGLSCERRFLLRQMYSYKPWR